MLNIDNEERKPIKVFIKLDEQNNIVDIVSEIFLNDTQNYFEIDSGYGDKFVHARSQYLDRPLIKLDGSYSYCYINNKIQLN